MKAKHANDCRPVLSARRGAAGNGALLAALAFALVCFWPGAGALAGKKKPDGKKSSAKSSSARPAPEKRPDSAYTVHALPFPSPNAETGLVYNASGAAALPDGRILFVDNRSARALYSFSLSADLRMEGAVEALPMDLHGPPPEDLEGLALVSGEGKPLLIGVGSMSIKRKARAESRTARGCLVRLVVDGGRVRADSMAGFRDWLVRQDPLLAQVAELEDKKGGLNVEGLAWDPHRQSLLLGFRCPLTDGRPIILPVRVKNLAGPWTPSNLVAGAPIRLNIAGAEGKVGIRDLQYDPRHGDFLVLLGSATRKGEEPFRLAIWDGGPEGVATVLPRVAFAAEMKPEGLARTVQDGRECLVIVDDAGGYAVLVEDPPEPEASPEPEVDPEVH